MGLFSAIRKIFQSNNVGSLLNASVNANTDLLSDVSISVSGVLRVVIVEDTGVTAKYKLTRGGTTITPLLNGGSSLNANASYVFDIPVKSGDTVNIQVGGNTNILHLDVFEITSASP